MGRSKLHLQHQVEQLIGLVPARIWSLQRSDESAAALSGAHGANRAAPGVATIAAADDRATMQAWIAARARSALTAKAYEREANRFILWCVLERRKALSDVGAEDCRAYMDFLANVPASWICRRHVPRLAPGWAPFAGPLLVARQRTLFLLTGAGGLASAGAVYLAARSMTDERQRLRSDRLF